MTATPEANQILLQHLGAQLEALRLAVYALAGQSDGSELLRHFDAGTTILLANQQGKPLPDDYLVLLEETIGRLRQALVAASAPIPGRPDR